MAKRKKLTLAHVWDFDDPRDMPAYSIAEAGHYLCMPKSTVRSWVSGTKRFRQVLVLPRSLSKNLNSSGVFERDALNSCQSGLHFRA